MAKCLQTELMRAACARKGHHSDLFKLQLGGARRSSQIGFSSNYTDDSARPPRLTVFEQLKSIKVLIYASLSDWAGQYPIRPAPRYYFL